MTPLGASLIALIEEADNEIRCAAREGRPLRVAPDTGARAVRRKPAYVPPVIPTLPTRTYRERLIDRGVDLDQD